MTWSLLDSGTALFADGSTGHVYSYPGGAPNSGDLLVLGVNSDTTVSTPSGWSAARSAVGNQGAYVFVRAAGASESGSVTVTTSGNFNTALSFRRYRGASTATPEVTASAQVNGVSGSASPAVSPGALSGSGRLCLMFAMNHGGSTAVASPTPSSGYTVAADTGLQGPGSHGAEHLVLERTDGSGSETPSVTWTNAFPDRYSLFVAFTPALDVSATVTHTRGRTVSATASSPVSGTVTHTRSASTTATASSPVSSTTAHARSVSASVAVSSPLTGSPSHARSVAATATASSPESGSPSHARSVAATAQASSPVSGTVTHTRGQAASSTASTPLDGSPSHARSVSSAATASNQVSGTVVRAHGADAVITASTALSATQGRGHGTSASAAATTPLSATPTRVRSADATARPGTSALAAHERTTDATATAASPLDVTTSRTRRSAATAEQIPPPPAPGSWYGLLAIEREVQQNDAQWRATRRWDCPHDGTTLLTGPRDGRQYCPFCGYRPTPQDHP